MILLLKTSEQPEYSVCQDEQDFNYKVQLRLDRIEDTRRLLAYYFENSNPKWSKYVVLVNNQHTIEIVSYIGNKCYVKFRPITLDPEMYHKRLADEVASGMYVDDKGKPVMVEVLHHKKYYKLMLDRLKKEEEALTKAAARWSGRKA